MMIISILLNIGESVRNYFLNSCDYIAIGLSVISIVVASFTLHSQRNTEKNTAPVITMEVQKMLWEFLIKQYYYKIQYLHILKIKLEDCSFQKRPEESSIRSLCISPENYIHEELFYDEKNVQYCGNVHWIKKHLSDYNLYVNTIANHLDQKKITLDNINKMYSFLDDLCKSTLKYYQFIFKIGHKADLIYFLDKELFDKQREEIKQKEKKTKEGIKNGKGLMKDKRYTREDAFVKYFEDFKKFKEDYYSIINDYIEFYMINKENRIILEDA